MNYRLAYAIGVHPREDAADDRPLVEEPTEPRRRFGPLIRGADGHEAEGALPE